MSRRLTTFIVAGMVSGVCAGFAANRLVGDTPETAREVADYFHLLADVFLHLIKMIIAPLVFSTLVAGMAHMGDSRALGRIGGRAMAWFLTASLLSLALGLILVNLLAPGEGLHLVRSGTASAVDSQALNFRDFVLHVFPTSMVGAMAENSILQVVVFSIFVGVALTALGEEARPIVTLIEAMVKMMLTVTGYVMRMAPLAVFGALAAAVTTEGIGVLATFGRLVGSFYLALGTLWLLLICAGALFLGRRILILLRLVREPVLLAFSTASSEAAYPKMLEQLDRFGVPRRIYSFILPLGYSFNLDGSMMYATFATLFIAQAYGIDLPVLTQITILLVLMVTSKGIAAVPRASLVVVAATLGQFDLPVEGIAFILAVDHFMDMGRTATNVLGNAIATAVVSNWEGDLDHTEMVYPEDHPLQRAEINGVL
ncbi:MAG: dicarboxylate/amino acid:cation symporter [Novosphingobium lindaniclasticum]|jgi:Na+/H+-dicarboxylate symporter|uniref:dicarboxylate/amino acid:cation symporter n=1 Tax=Novosphingobium lindaniclasticum TaxID=1329895 RepID=UPI0024098225|nr:dicarboxylate/amino acid:cation symporter [Novosphingobium lindaniclasticum]MDF2640587.1 dicarboxylate/amino acid:cation symporter [Novosphingobium lindaniclasticum]